MIVCGQPALIEDSQLTCFLGGTVSIFYSPEAAKKAASINRSCMWWDLAGVVLNSAIISGAMAGVAGFFKGTKLLAQGCKILSKEMGVYVGANLAGVGAGLGIGYGLTSLKAKIYESIPIGESTYQKYVSGAVVVEKAAKMDDAVDKSGGSGGTDILGKTKDALEFVPQDIKFKSGMVDAVVTANVKGLGIPKAYATASGVSLIKSSAGGFGLSVIDDGINAMKSIMLIKALDESDHFDSLESTAKAGVKVCENDI
jgi:hypothetical protein